jgi:hypothetical protein
MIMKSRAGKTVLTACLVLAIITTSASAYVEDWNYTSDTGLAVASGGVWPVGHAPFGDKVIVTDSGSTFGPGRYDPQVGNFIHSNDDGSDPDGESIYLNHTDVSADLVGPYIRLETSVFMGAANSDVFWGVGSISAWSPGSSNNPAFVLHAERFRFRIADATGAFTEHYDFNEFFHVKWWNVRMEIDPTANSGDGELNFFYKEPSETVWRQSSVLSGLNLLLSQAADASLTNPVTDWTDQFIRIKRTQAGHLGEGRMGPLSITSVSTPTPPPPPPPTVLLEEFVYPQSVGLETVSSWDPQLSGSELKAQVSSLPPSAAEPNYVFAAGDASYFIKPNFGTALDGPFILIELTAYAKGTNSHVFFGMGNWGFNSSVPGAAFLLRFVPGELTIFDAAGAANVSGNFDPGVIYDLLLAIDPAANGDDGSLRLFSRVNGTVPWIGDSLLANINLNLSAKSSVDEPSEWLALFMRLNSNSAGTDEEGRLYSIKVESDSSLPLFFKATNPDPEIDASWVAPDAQFSWTPGDTAVFHDVYFGITAEPNDMVFQEQTVTASFDPGPMKEATTFFWRIDERDSNGDLLVQGDVWTFTTRQPYPLLAGESFIYSAPQPDGWPLEGRGFKGFGWDGNWQDGGYVYAEIRPGSLNPTFFYPLGTAGERLQHDNVNRAGFGGFEAWRRLAQPVDLSVDQDYYLSFLVWAEETGANAEDFVEGDFQFRQADVSTLGFAAGLYPQGKSLPGEDPNMLAQPEFYLRGVDGTTVVHGGSWAANTVYMVILKISASSVGNDSVSMAVYSPSNPLAIGAVEPVSWLLTIDTLASDDVFSVIWIENQVADQFAQIGWDEIRLGFTWGSVTGWPGECRDPGTLFDYDLNKDCYTDYEDHALLAQKWMEVTVPGSATPCQDIDGSGDVGMTDLEIITANWLSCTNPTDAACDKPWLP